MFHPFRPLQLAGLLVVLATTGAGAQDTAMPKDGMMKDSMMKEKLDHGMAAGHGMMTLRGSFTGANGHVVSGGYQVIDKDGGRALMLEEGFVLDGAPDPYIVLSATDKGSGSGTLNLGLLKRQKGASAFAIPAGTDLARYTRVLVWCKKFNVTLGAADLAAGTGMMHK